MYTVIFSYNFAVHSMLCTLIENAPVKQRLTIILSYCSWKYRHVKTNSKTRCAYTQISPHSFKSTRLTHILFDFSTHTLSDSREIWFDSTSRMSRARDFISGIAKLWDTNLRWNCFISKYIVVDKHQITYRMKYNINCIIFICILNYDAK